MMKRLFVATVLMGLVAFDAVSAEAAEPDGTPGRAGHQIVVVNESVTPVRVYVEDAHGRRYELGCLERGETKEFDAPAGVVDRGDFRVRVHPDYYTQHVDDPVKITTRALNVSDGETIILWLERDLSRSTVEVWAG